jgi:RIO-like serine/threonine protein kinase
VIIRQATSTRPLVRFVEINGIRAIVKDFSRNSFFFRNVIGRFLVWRETRAYRKLAGLKGVPGLLQVAAGPSMVMEAVPGMDLKEAAKHQQIGPGFFDALKDLVDKIHERGVAHCDLKASGNILVNRDGSPVIIDWGASISASEFRLPVLKMIYKRFVVDDYRAVTKHKLRYNPDSVGVEEKEQYDYRSRAEKGIRAVRDKLRSLLQTIL